MKYVVNTHEVGLLFENDSFVKALPPKTYRMLPFSSKRILTVSMADKFNPGNELSIYLKDQTLRDMLDVIHIKDSQISFHYADGIFCDILPPGSHAYFNTLKKHSFVTLETNDPFIPQDIDEAIFNREYFKKEGSRYIHTFAVSSGKAGILTQNGHYVKTLPPGNHYFLKGPSHMEVRVVDTRKTLMEISGQELLSEDKVTLRINFICQFRVTDPIKTAMEFDSFEMQLYTTLQLAIREYVSTRKLDELLAQKHEIGKIILDSIKHKEKDFGLEFMEAGVKDIILPGDIKEILNTVLVAEKKALANVISRREETASTRSLLNTAKLMEENKTLYKLKELEYLERICDKVGNISISANSSILEQLTAIVGRSGTL